jgi:hypothetical protein
MHRHGLLGLASALGIALGSTGALAGGWNDDDYSYYAPPPAYAYAPPVYYAPPPVYYPRPVYSYYAPPYAYGYYRPRYFGPRYYGYAGYRYQPWVYGGHRAHWRRW